MRFYTPDELSLQNDAVVQRIFDFEFVNHSNDFYRFHELDIRL